MSIATSITSTMAKLVNISSRDMSSNLVDNNSTTSLRDWYSTDPSPTITTTSGSGERLPCETVLRFADTSYFFLFENPVIVPLLCPHVAYWTVLRDPIDRLISRLSQPLPNGTSSIESISVAEAKAVLMLDSASPMQREFAGFIPSVINNWHVRSLCGPAVYNLGLGRVNSSHLEEAKAALGLFDLVVPMPDIASIPEIIADQLRIPLQEEAERAKRQRGLRLSSRPWQYQLTDASFIGALRSHNLLDIGLYDHALQLFNIRMASIRATPIATRWQLGTQ